MNRLASDASLRKALSGLARIAALPAAVCLLAAAGCLKDRPAVRPQAAPAAEIVSETQCAACHASESTRCAAGNHMRTIRKATPSALGRLTPPSSEIAGSGYRVRVDGDRLLLSSTEGKQEERVIDYALGSGKTGMTFVALNDAETLTELRMSWYADRKTWYLTPGQERDTDNELGDHNDKTVSRMCVQCHATALEKTSIRPAEGFYGVGCQSCHGPASEHVAAVKSGNTTDLKIARLSERSPQGINDLCGTCHRRPSQIGGLGNEVTMTQRFQPYGITQSACFKKSGGKLSCVTCHDPHSNASRDLRHYEAACLDCHNSAGGAVHKLSETATKSKVCPVNPKGGCIPCHMPKRKVFAFSRIPIEMADHMIWAYPDKPK